MTLRRGAIFWTVLAFVTNLGHMAFAMLIGHHFDKGEFGVASVVLNFINMLGLPVAIASTALIHYVSHFRSHNDEARLQGLLAGCRSFLRNATILGSVLALVLVVPLGRFFDIRPTLLVAATVCILVGLWSGFALALCQGMAWFQRIALIGFAAVVFRLAFGYFVALPINTAEMAVSATTFGLLANLAVLYWWKDIFKRDAHQISPWTTEFFNFMIVSAAYVGGNWCFTQGDSLAAKHNYFPAAVLGLYVAAGQFGRAIPNSVGPLLQAVFISRSGKHNAEAASDQRLLLFLYAAGLAVAALVLILLRGFCVRLIFGNYTPESAAMVPRMAITMAFAGLNYAIATWCLAGRSFKITILYGVLGLAYWISLLFLGRDPDTLLSTMVIGSSVSFVILCGAWLWTFRRAT